MSFESVDQKRIRTSFRLSMSMRIKCPYWELFWSTFSRIWTEYGDCRVNFRIQSECGKILTRKIPNTDTFYAACGCRIWWIECWILKIRLISMSDHNLEPILFAYANKSLNKKITTTEKA